MWGRVDGNFAQIWTEDVGVISSIRQKMWFRISKFYLRLAAFRFKEVNIPPPPSSLPLGTYVWKCLFFGQVKHKCKENVSHWDYEPKEEHNDDILMVTNKRAALSSQTGSTWKPDEQTERQNDHVCSRVIKWCEMVVCSRNIEMRTKKPVKS